MDNVDKGRVVAIMAEGKEHAMGVGFTKMSTEEIRKVNKDVALETIFFLNDGIWQVTKE